MLRMNWNTTDSKELERWLKEELDLCVSMLINTDTPINKLEQYRGRAGFIKKLLDQKNQPQPTLDQ